MVHLSFKYQLLLVVLCIAHNTKAQLFTLTNPSATGIKFENKLAETPQLNAITYEYFYNGGGVAAADFNNDGLIDLYFTSNLTSNKLYLNKGNFKFQDITASAGVAGRKKGWRTGVTVADVNGDGLMDIYVCYSGNVDSSLRRNQLFINNGDLTFTESAKKYGLDDPGYSTQAVFFDYDHDGDLDMFLLNHNVKSFRNFDASYVRKMVDKYAGDKLFRNDNGKFVDVSRTAGIISNPLSYGLGVAVADVNNDGWPDIYVSNDYVEPDYLYINNKDGTFTESLQQQIGHISHFSMGSDIADINNDGLPDIYTLDMLPADNKRQKLLFAPNNYEVYNNMVSSGFYHQMMRNMLQLNNGNGTFSEVGQLMNISATDWSWAALFADFDNDGWKDLMVTNGYGRDLINRDFMKFYADERLKYLRNETSENMFRMLQGIKQTPLHNYLFKNEKGKQFKDVSAQWGFTAKDFANGAIYADLDNDGDLDVVLNRINDTAAVYRNNYIEQGGKGKATDISFQYKDKNKNGIGTKMVVFCGTQKLDYEFEPVRGFQSAMSVPLHIGLGNKTVDSAIVTWPDGTTQVINTLLFEQPRITISYKPTGIQQMNPLPKQIFNYASVNIPFKHTEEGFNDFKIQPLMPSMISYSGPHICKGDVNNDGLEDIFICGAKGQAGQLFLGQKDHSYKKDDQPAFDADAQSEDVDAIFFDADGDGDLDLYVVSGGYDFKKGDSALTDRLYFNENGKFVKHPGALPADFISGSCVRAADIDGDGDIDLFVGGRVIPGEYPVTPESRVLINNGKGIFTDETNKWSPTLKQVGMVTDALWMDVNGDGKKDLIVCGEWMPIKCFINTGRKLEDSTISIFGKNYSGWWGRLAAFDFDHDGDIDLMAGNCGNNSQIKVSDDKPAEIYYGDFDNNGSVDPIVCYYIGDACYPMASRDEITDQMTSLRKKFPTYDSYSEATIKDILTDDQLAKASRLTANCFDNIYFENKNGKFIAHVLPKETEESPVFAIAVDDFNHDGNADVVFGGNTDYARIKTGKCDANYGMLLLGDGKGNFKYQSQLTSGLNVKGAVRDEQVIKQGNDSYLIFGINNAMPVIYKY